MVYHHLAKFGCHRYCSNRDMFLLNPVIKQDIQGKSPPCQVWWSRALWQWKYNGFSLSLDLTKLHDHWVEYVYGWKLLKVNHHPTIFGSHRHCGIGDIMVLPWSQ